MWIEIQYGKRTINRTDISILLETLWTIFFTMKEQLFYVYDFYDIIDNFKFVLSLIIIGIYLCC